MRAPPLRVWSVLLLAASLTALPPSSALAQKKKKKAKRAEPKSAEAPPEKSDVAPTKAKRKKEERRAPASPAGAGAEGWVIGIGLQLYADDVEIEAEERVGPTRRGDQPIDDAQEYDALDSLSGSIWALRALNGWARAGGGVRYYGTYALEERLDEDADEDEEAESYELGRLFEVYATAEAIVPVSRSLGLDVIIGLDAGVSLLVVGGDLEEEIEAAEQAGAGVNALPRPGFLIGPRIGARYALWSDKLAARLDLGGRYGRSYLFATTDEIDGVAYAKEWTLTRVRYEASIGLELAL